MPDSLRVRLRIRKVATSDFGFIAVEADIGSDAAIATKCSGFLQVVRHYCYLSERVIPPSHQMQGLAESPMRLCQPDRRPDLVRKVPCLLCRCERLIAAIEAQQRYSFVDLQQQSKVC